MHTPPTLSTIIIRITLFLFVLLLIDFYAFKGIRSGFSFINSSKTKQLITYTYWGITALFVTYTIAVFFTFDRNVGPQKTTFAILLGIFVLLYVPKLVLCIFLLAEDAFRLLRAAGVGVGKVVSSNFTDTSYFISRRQFVSQIGIALAAIPFIGILYGVTKGKYNYTVHKVKLKFKNLPEAFHGLTITQLSDIHVGSFDNRDEVKRGIELVNEQKSDLVFFTGDMVNNHAHEMEPWIDVFNKIEAPLGKYSILGNHDYGDYVEWNSVDEKNKNLNRLKEIHQELGFKLLLNEHVKIKKDADELNLVGIENWGTGGFAQYGDLSKALTGLPNDAFKILLSHDPSHWEEQVKNNASDIHLTLAGHTHGMQFGVEIPWLKWSPVKYRYPRWAGLYAEDIKHLYVNRGFGFIGFPGRVGIWPEITVITLERA